MDSLSALPPKNDTLKTPEEEAVLGQLFPPSYGGNPPQNQQMMNVQPQNPQQQPNQMIQPPPQPQKNIPPGKMNWKLIGISTMLFLILANPWIDKLLCKIPYCEEGSMSLIGIKALLFALLLVIANYFS